MSCFLAKNIFEALLAFTRFEFLLSDPDSGNCSSRDFDFLEEEFRTSSFYEDERLLKSLLEEILKVCPEKEFDPNSLYIFERLRDHWSIPKSPDSQEFVSISKPPSSYASSSSSQNWFIRRAKAFRLKLEPLKKFEESELVITMPPQDENFSRKPMIRMGSFRCSNKEEKQNHINIRRVKSFALSEKVGEMKKTSSLRRRSSKILMSMFRKKNLVQKMEESSKKVDGIAKSNSCKMDDEKWMIAHKKVASCKSFRDVIDEREKSDRIQVIANDTESTRSMNSSACSVIVGSGSSTSVSELDQENETPMNEEPRFMIRSPSPDISINEQECHPKLHKIGEKLKNLLAPNDQHHFTQFRRLFHNLVPEGDDLIMSFGCTYQAKPREFPSQGRLYLTLTSLGFNCSLFGSEKKFVISLKNVANVERDKPTRLFSSGIKIKTSSETHHFNSLKSRDKVFTLIYRVWQMYGSPEKVDDIDGAKLRNEITKRPMPEVGLPDSEYPIHGDTASEASGSGSSTTSSVHISENEEPVTCPCVEHKGRPLLDEEYPLAVEQMFVLLFTENPWLKTFSESVRRSEMVYEPWRKGDEPGARIRNYSYRMELTQSFGPKFTNITEIQICTEIGTSGEGYVISKEACNSGIPYADSFSVNCTYCLTRVSPNSCRLRVHGGMVYKKSIFMGIKGIIERSTTNGLEEYYKALNSALSSETDNLSQVIQQRVEDGFETEIYDADSRIATLTHANHVQPISNHFVNNSLSTTLDKTSPVSNAVSNYDLSQLELLNSINTTLRIIAFLLAILAMSFIFSLFWRSSNVTERNLYCGKDFEQLQESLVNLVRHDPSHNFNEIKSLLHSIHEKLYRSQ